MGFFHICGASRRWLRSQPALGWGLQEVREVIAPLALRVQPWALACIISLNIHSSFAQLVALSPLSRRRSSLREGRASASPSRGRWLSQKGFCFAVTARLWPGQLLSGHCWQPLDDPALQGVPDSCVFPSATLAFGCFPAWLLGCGRNKSISNLLKAVAKRQCGKKRPGGCGRSGESRLWTLGLVVVSVSLLPCLPSCPFPCWLEGRSPWG